MSSTAEGRRKLSSPIHLKWNNLHVKVGEKYILQNVTAEVKPGEILAIMGPSGAGKSTLLNMLSGRNKGMVVEQGEILINEQPANKLLRRQIGYVMQEDIFLSHLTVKQSLQFIGELLIPDTMTKAEKEDIVDNVVEELGLRKCLDTAMGGGMLTSGCSGGEKKRCSIAVEMIKNPGMLILDEPTSGLDAAIACQLIKSIKHLAEKDNRAVITSIHQPSSHVFHMFDKLLLLCNGKVAFYGRTSRVLNFFQDMGMPCYDNWNPADYILEKLTDGPEIEEKIIKRYSEVASFESQLCNVSDDGPVVTKDDDNNKDDDNDDDVDSNGYVKVNDACAKVLSYENVSYSAQEEGTNMTSPVQNGGKQNGSVASHDVKVDVVTTPASQSVGEVTEEKKWPTGFRTQFMALCTRAFIQTNKLILDRFGFGQALGVALAVSLIWFQTEYTEEKIVDRNGVCFFIMVYLIMNPMFFSILTFPAERDTIAKERGAGMYRLSAYFMAKNVSEFPVLLVQPYLIYTLVYWLTGLNRSAYFLVGLLLVTTICLLAQSIGYCAGALITNIKKCISICVVFALTMMLLGGFYTRRMPAWLKWARYISHISHAYNIQHRLEFLHATKTFKCATESIFEKCKNNSTNYITGADIHEKYETLSTSIGESFLILWIYIIFCRSLFYVVLRYFNRPK